MFKQINNYHLSLLLIIVFILNTILFQAIKMSKAQWTPPTGAPGQETSNIVTSPLSAGLDLGGYSIFGEGNIGIGVISPDVLLHLSSSSDAELFIHSTGGSTDAIIELGTNTTNENARLYVDESDARKFHIGTGGGITTPRLTILQGGDVGIGTDSPDYNLEIEDSSGASIGINATSGDPNLMFIDNSNLKWWLHNNGGDDKFHFRTGSLSSDIKMTLQQDGNIGIGIEEPNKNLHIYDIRPGDYNAEIDLQSVGVAGDDSHWAMYHDSGTEELRFWHGEEDRLTMKSDGNINTSNDLTIGGNLKMNGDICDDNGNCIEDLITTLNYLLSDLPYVWLNGFGVGQTASFTWPMGSAVTLPISVKLDNSPGESEGWQLIASDPALVVVSGTDWQVGGEGLWEAPGWVNVVEIDRMNTAEERTLTLKFISKSTNAYKYFYLTLPRYPIDQ